MSKLLQQPIPYRKDSALYIDQIADSPWTIFLDSCRSASDYGRFDIVVSQPSATLITQGQHTVIEQNGHRRESSADPFDLVRELIGEPIVNRSDLPFVGGALGYYAYDLGRRIEKLPTIAEDDLELPEIMLGIYDWALVVDHLKEKTTFVTLFPERIGDERLQELIAQFSSVEEKSDSKTLELSGMLQSNLDKAAYQSAFDAIQRYIREGDCYQVNLAQRFQVPCDLKAWAIYRRLRELNPAPYSAYMNLPSMHILSCSPERFLKLRGGDVETKPIKGTIARSSDRGRDEQLKQELQESIKDRAENLMIVDLLRNDLGKVCVPGSIQVPRLFEIESFPSVHHLVSTVTGELEETEDALTLLRAAFPGGSITGAPKLRAMEIIEELEPHRRGIYCGAIGYISYDGNMDSSIAIRTFTYKNGVLSYSAGGGIVSDSTCGAEYRETYQKAEAIFQLFNQKSSS